MRRPRLGSRVVPWLCLVLIPWNIVQPVQAADEPAAKPAPADPQEPPIPVDVVVVTPTFFKKVDRSRGTVEASLVVPLRPKIGGYVENVTVDLGDSVTKGQPLVTISSPELIATRATVHARSELAEIDHRRAEIILKQTHERGGKESRDLAEIDLLAATARRAIARAELEKADVDLASLRLAAPIEGVITTRSVVPGQLVKGGDPPLLVISKLDPVKLCVHYNAGIASRLHRGDSVTVVNPDGNDIEAQVGLIGPTFDSEARLRVEIPLKNPDNRWRPGMSTYVDFVTTLNPKALLIPHAAIFFAQNQSPACFRVSNGHAEGVYLKLGERDDTLSQVEVLSGLNLGDQVVMGKSNFGSTVFPESLHHGSPIRINSSTKSTAEDSK